MGNPYSVDQSRQRQIAQIMMSKKTEHEDNEKDNNDDEQNNGLPPI
jgi:hypothetical protein